MRSAFYFFLTNTVKVAVILSIIKYTNYLHDIYMKQIFLIINNYILILFTRYISVVHSCQPWK